MPVNRGARPVLPLGGHSTQCEPPPPVPEERAAPPVGVLPVRPPPELPDPPDPLADDPDAAPLPAPVDDVVPVAVVAFPEADGVGRTIAPPAAG